MASTAGRRVYRVAERLREIIAKKLLQVSDPRFNLVSVTYCTISPDLREAKVYWSVSGDDQRKAEVKEAFEYARGYFQSAIGKDLGLKFSPQVRFYYDNTLDVFEHVDSLLRKVRKNEPSEEEEND